MKAENRLYLRGLNGFRAIAAMAVIFSHINLNLHKFSMPDKPGLQLASFGVTVFFTLSGFLITYLLLKEKEKTCNISIKKFYIRRLLRIWPLYFLYLGIIVVWNSRSLGYGLWPDLLYYIFFIPNLAFILGNTVNLLVHYWSLGVEEQFYAFWPVIVKRIRNLGVFLVFFVLSFLVLKLVAKYLDPSNLAYAFLHYTRFGCMAIGAAGAVLLTRRSNILSLIHHWSVEAASWALVVLISLNHFHVFSIIDHEIVAIATVALILNQVNNPKPLISLEKNIFNYLGKISYGLYVFNPLVIELSARLFSPLKVLPEPTHLFLLYLTIPLLVVATSHLSFIFFENKFLLLKDRFTVIQTTASK